MYLENICLDAHDPHLVGRFWEALLGCTTLLEEPDAFETRLSVPGGPAIDLCVQRVPDPPTAPLRLHLDLSGGAQQGEVVERALALGASHLDIGQGDVPWVVLADPEGTPFCVMEERPEYAASGPIAALPLDSSDPARDVAFWAELSGWVPMGTPADGVLRHPSGRGPLLELCPEEAPKTAAKNRLHLDIRLETSDDSDAVLARVLELAGSVVKHDWGELPWQVVADPSGNELCLLPARRG
jgi:predicted enzyme related to lactoylglutathione lyase